MIWPLPGAVAVTAMDGQRTLRASWQSMLQLSSGKQEVHPALVKTGTRPEALRIPTEQRVTKPGSWRGHNWQERKR